MANKRVFVSFAIEDETNKNLFCGMAKNKSVPYDFVDMSVKEPWSDSWKANCRSRIKGCNGAVVLVSENTKNASGALWEIKCALEEKIPMVGIYIDGASWLDKPAEMSTVTCKEWTWDNVRNFIEGL